MMCSLHDGDAREHLNMTDHNADATSKANDDSDGPSLLSSPLFDPQYGVWHVLHTKSRQEKALSAELERLDILHFLPLVTQTRYYGKRKFRVSEPLFPGYVFLRGPIERAYAADRTSRVANIIHVADQFQLDWELRNLALAMDQRVPLDPYPFLKVGIRVRVKAGPFMGLQGVIESKEALGRLVLQIRMLGQAVSVPMDGALLELID
jgi:transcription termination/antitermination protein NusG